jgi:hypothetical protein
MPARAGCDTLAGMTFGGSPLGTGVLFVAHPGHELCLHGWLEQARPRVFVLTDGSGAARVSRVDATARVIARCGAEPGSVFGRLSDRDIYRAMIEGDVAPVAGVVRELAAALTSRDDAYLVADPWEFYNPCHDLCRVIADLARAVAAAACGRSIPSFDYVLTARTRNTAPAVTIALDDLALERKIQAADAYTELRAEVEAAIARYGKASLQREHLYAIEEHEPLKSPGRTPFYETFGEERVAAGEYATVLRYERHFLPFAIALARTVGAPEALSPVTGDTA